jgi:hypothetical protein
MKGMSETVGFSQFRWDDQPTPTWDERNVADGIQGLDIWVSNTRQDGFFEKSKTSRSNARIKITAKRTHEKVS